MKSKNEIKSTEEKSSSGSFYDHIPVGFKEADIIAKILVLLLFTVVIFIIVKFA